MLTQLAKMEIDEVAEEIYEDSGLNKMEKYRGYPGIVMPNRPGDYLDPGIKTDDSQLENIECTLAKIREEYPNDWVEMTYGHLSDTARATYLYESYEALLGDIPRAIGKLKKECPVFRIGVVRYLSGCTSIHGHFLIDDIWTELQFMDDVVDYGKNLGDPFYKEGRLLSALPNREKTWKDSLNAYKYKMCEGRLQQVVNKNSDRLEFIDEIDELLQSYEFPKRMDLNIKRTGGYSYDNAMTTQLSKRDNTIDTKVAKSCIGAMHAPTLEVQDKLGQLAGIVFPGCVHVTKSGICVPSGGVSIESAIAM